MRGRPPSSEVLTIIAALVEERAGLHYRIDDRELLGDKLQARADDAGFESLLDYYYLLRYDDPGGVELQRLIEALLVHETYFFRELDALEVAIDHFVVPLHAAGRRPRVWSAACATGEEPLTIAILLAERGILDGCEIVATDVSNPALERARAGRYRSRSLRMDGLALAARWLEKEGDSIIAPARLRDAIELKNVNVCDDDAVAALGTFDLIVCRNMLIYFAEATVTSVVERLTDRLPIGGALLVGVSESLLRFSRRLVGDEIRGAFVYRRSE
jgi:chemotaxis protein methyltransferase CheR